MLISLLKSFIYAPFESWLYKLPSPKQADLPEGLSVRQARKWSEVSKEHRRMLLDYRNFIWYLRYITWILTKRACLLLVFYRGYPAHVTMLMVKAGVYKKIFKISSARSVIVGPCYTSESFRRKGIFPAVLRYAGNLVNVKWEREAYIAVDVENQSSIRGIEKAHCQRIGRFKGARYFSFWIYSKKEV